MSSTLNGQTCLETGKENCPLFNMKGLRREGFRTWAGTSGTPSATATTEHASTTSSRSTAAAKTVREVGHELLALPLYFLFVCIYRKGNQRGKTDWVPPAATERLLILMIFLNALKGNNRRLRRKHGIYSNGQEDQEPPQRPQCGTHPTPPCDTS